MHGEFDTGGGGGGGRGDAFGRTPPPSSNNKESDDEHGGSPNVSVFARGVVAGILDMGLTDCQAVATFADTIAAQYSNTSQFVSSFSTITPVGFYSIPGTPGAQDIGAGGGFKPGFQNNFPNPDREAQSHHFAFYLQFGYKYAMANLVTAGIVNTVAPVLGEILQTQFGNIGDMALGNVAAQIGAAMALHVPGWSPKDVGKIVRSTLCN